LRANLEIFLDEYYNQQRLHSALGYRTHEEFERQAQCPSETADPKAATITFVVGLAQSSTGMLEQGTQTEAVTKPAVMWL
jgi:putative transposase